MIHLMLGLDPGFIRREPYIPTANEIPAIRAAEVGVTISGRGLLQCLPGVGAYVGSDVVADVLASGMHLDEDLSLLIDIGTNGEIVLGNRDWLICCSASAGPSFEGGGMRCGLRATEGAIERVSIDQDGRAKYRTIGGLPARGICGSGMIDLVAGLFCSGHLDKSRTLPIWPAGRDRRAGRMGVRGRSCLRLGHRQEPHRERDGHRGLHPFEGRRLYRRRSARPSSGTGVRGCEPRLHCGRLRLSPGHPQRDYYRPDADLPADRFHFVGNGSLDGARLALLSQDALRAAETVAERMTYFDLSTDATFMNRFTSSLFIPHTDVETFPSVVLAEEKLCRT